VYAGLGPSLPHDYLEYGLDRKRLPTGVLVGTVEVVDCYEVYASDDPKHEGPLYAYVFSEPRRLRQCLTPENHPQPTWFRPFDA